MKKKSFKKMLAGVSAVAMLASAMPMSLIADAYSYNNVASVGGFTDLSTAITAGTAGTKDANQNGGVSYGNGTNGTFSTTLTGFEVELEKFDITKYARYQINEVMATNPVNGNTIITSAEYDWAAAKADIIESNPTLIKDVTFDQTTTSANFGKIAAIKLSMPVNNGNGGVNDIVYEDINFTVARTKADIIASFSNNPTNEERSIILANDINIAGETLTGTSLEDSLKKQLSYTGNININLNGHNFNTVSGIQVSGMKMRIWGTGTISSIDDLNTAATVALANGSAPGFASTLSAYGSDAVIELYDGVTISNLEDTDDSKAAIAGEGTLIMCGDEVVVGHAKSSTGKALNVGETGGIAKFVAGDYEYRAGSTTVWDKSDAGTDGADKFSAYAATVGTTAQKFVTKKIHNYNQWGFEVTDRGTDATKWAASTKYLDTDPRTTGIQYGYQPVRNSADDGVELSGPSKTVKVTNIGQLYYLAQNINNGNFTTAVTVKLQNTEFDFSNAPTNWTPIDASNITLDIDGKFTESSIDKYSVIKNMKITAAGNAGFIAKTQTNVANVVKNIGFENVSVTSSDATTGYAGVIVGYGENVTIQNAYVNNSGLTKAVKGGKYNGAIAGMLYNSAIDHTYSAADVDSVALISGSTVTYLAKDGVKTAEGMTNFYDSTLCKTPGGSTKTYLVAETSTNFKNGTVAFKLNGHNPAQIVASGDLIAWADGTNKGNSANCASVNGAKADGTAWAAPYNGIYENDIFGQDLSTTGKGKSYPTFINITDAASGANLASNRVFREVVSTCTGNKAEWKATGANFLNTEIDPTKGGHTDADSNGICETCGAYEISEKNFDKSLIPFLTVSAADKAKYGSVEPDNDSTATPAHDGWLNKTEINAINKVYFDLTTADTNTLKVADIVNAINAAAPTGTAADKRLKGLNILNQKVSGSSLVAAAPGDAERVDEFVFMVNDKVLCRMVGSTDDDKKTGYLVATGATATNGFAAATNETTPGDPITSGINYANKAYVETVDSETGTAGTKDVYVFADRNMKYASGNYTGAIADTNGGSYPTAQFTYGNTNKDSYTILFSGVKHNDAEDKKDDGTWDIDSSTPGTPGNGEKVKVVEAADNKSTHTYSGVDCGCTILTEECNGTITAIDGLQHKMECSVCKHSSKTTAENHDFAVVFTSGAVTFERCMGCGYARVTKDANITVGAPTIELVESEDSVMYRQKYAFNIAGGDKTILSYGVLYSKTGVAINTDKIASAASSKYFNTTGAIVPSELGGLQYSSKKNIKTSGTYNVSVSMEDMTTDVNICGYVVYKDAAGAIGVAKTDVLTNNYEAIAIDEIESNCATYWDKAGRKDEGTTKYRQRFVTDVETGFTIKTVGVIIDKKTALNSVADDTTIDNMNAATMTKTAATPTRQVQTVIYAPTTTKANSAQKARCYAEIEYKGVTHVIYGDAAESVNA